jgi:hypothetical protein
LNPSIISSSLRLFRRGMIVAMRAWWGALRDHAAVLLPVGDRRRAGGDASLLSSGRTIQYFHSCRVPQPIRDLLYDGK